jgi:hypothetical protein
MADLDVELSAFKTQLFDLESLHFGKWVVFHGLHCAGVYDEFESAAVDAIKRFGVGPYLIRQVGAPPISLPVCIVQRQTDERSTVRL